MTVEFPQFESFMKIGRLSREVVITEKIDGTNGQIQINEDGRMFIGSRSQWLAEIVGDQANFAQYAKSGKPVDNHGFAGWCFSNRDELRKLGPGRHFGEWWGAGIQRGYNISDKRWSLFNVGKWSDDAIRPKCCHVVPVIWRGDFDTSMIVANMNLLQDNGSYAAPGFMNPEGVVIFHAQARVLFKKTFEKDDAGKGKEPIAEMSA